MGLVWFGGIQILYSVFEIVITVFPDLPQISPSNCGTYIFFSFINKSEKAIWCSF